MPLVSFVDLKTANCIDSINPELTLMDVSVLCTSCLLAADGFLQILRGAAASGLCLTFVEINRRHFFLLLPSGTFPRCQDWKSSGKLIFEPLV